MPTYTEPNLKKKEFSNLFMVILAEGRYFRYSVCVFSPLLLMLKYFEDITALSSIKCLTLQMPGY